MITLFSGTPGSGKSLYAAYEIINLLNLNRGVIANFPIDLSFFGRKKNVKFTYLDNAHLTVRNLKDYSKKNHVLGKESQTTIIIDEASTFFNPREFDRSDRLEWITFLQQHRKLGFNVILISQLDRMIDRQIRGFIEIEYKFRAIKNYKLFGFLLSLIFGGFFVRVEYWYPVKIKCQSHFFFFNRRKANIYNTFEIFN